MIIFIILVLGGEGRVSVNTVCITDGGFKFGLMEMGFEVIRRIHEQGGSFLVVIPKIWIDAKKLEEGDKVRIMLDDKITIEAFERERKAA